MKDRFMREINMVIKKIKIIFYFYYLSLTKTNLHSLENRIILKIENQIITSIDLENEIKYLTALNQALKH